LPSNPPPEMGQPGEAVPQKALRRFARKQTMPTVKLPGERCELCSAPLPSKHRHLLNLSNRAILCACHACSLLFHKAGAGNGQYRLLPERYIALPDFQITDEQWDELMLPVNMVYIFQDSVTRHARAFYPSPAGATESLLSLNNWQELVNGNPILRELEPDVEALLINRIRDAREYYIVPLDVCYRLVGVIRLSWHGLSGGEAVWSEITRLFAEIRAWANDQQCMLLNSNVQKGVQHA
jgi:hypothetical protein